MRCGSALLNLRSPHCTVIRCRLSQRIMCVPNLQHARLGKKTHTEEEKRTNILTTKVTETHATMQQRATLWPWLKAHQDKRAEHQQMFVQTEKKTISLFFLTDTFHLSALQNTAAGCLCFGFVYMCWQIPHRGSLLSPGWHLLATSPSRTGAVTFWYWSILLKNPSSQTCFSHVHVATMSDVVH